LRATLTSNVLATLGGVSWAASVIVAKKLGKRKDIQLLSLTAWQMLFGVIPLVILAWAIPSRPIEWSGYFVFALAYAGILATVIGWLLWLYVLNHLPAGTASINALAIPVVAVLGAWIQLGEKPDLFELAGMLTIAAALTMVALLKARAATKIPLL
jgi:drug/metabolite transporter (DMT)-like permease